MDNSLKALATNQLYQLWSERVKDCRNSGLPVKTWCFNNNVKVSTYYAWQKRLFNDITKPEPTEIQRVKLLESVLEEYGIDIPHSEDNY